MKALIIADDKGAGLRPLTLTCPVAGLKILGKPWIEHITDKLKAAGIEEICAVCGMMGGSLGGVFCTHGNEFELQSFIGGDDVLVIDGGAVEEIDYVELLRAHKEHFEELGAITLAKGAAVFSGPVKGIFAECVEIIKNGDGKFSKVISDKFGGKVHPFESGYFKKIESPRDYIDVCLATASGAVSNNIKAKFGEITVSETATVSASAKLSGTVFIGNNCIIGKDTVLHNCIIGDGSVVGEGVSVSESVISGSGRLLRGCKVAGSVLCGQVVVCENSELDSAVMGRGASCGKGSVLCRGVRLWPRVEVEAGSVVKRSIIGRGEEEVLLFKECGIDGKCLTKRLPAEKMTRLGCAVGSSLGFGATVVVCSNEHGAAQMLASAVTAGLASTGAKVKTAVDIELPVIRWVCRSGAADGAVFIDNRGDLTVTILDKHGNDIPSHLRKRVQNSFEADDFITAAETEMMMPEPLSDPEDYYVADMGKQFPYAYRAFRLRGFSCGRARREAIIAYIIGKLYPDTPIFVSKSSALAATAVAEKMGSRVITCGDKAGDVMEAMEPFMKLSGVYNQYLMLYDDFAFELALCHFKAVTGEDAETSDNTNFGDNIIKRTKAISCDNLRKGELLKRMNNMVSERMTASSKDGASEGYTQDFPLGEGESFSRNSQGNVRIIADDRKPILNVYVESFSEEFAADIMGGLEEVLEG